MSLAPRNLSELTEIAVDCASSGDNTLIAAVANRRIRVYRGFLIAASSVAATVKDGASTSLTGAMTIGSAFWSYDTRPWFTTTAGNAFILNLGGAVQVSGRLYYIQV